MWLLNKIEKWLKWIQELSVPFFIKVQINGQQQLIVFLFFLALSTLFWLMQSLNKENYVTSISYPVNYNNFPSNKVLISKLPQRLILEIRGNGYALLNYKISPRLDKVNFDFNTFSLNKINNNTQSFYTLTRYTKQDWEEKFKHKVEIIDIKPDTLKFTFSDKVGKVLKVYPNTHIVPAKSFMFNNPIYTSPDSIQVYGPLAIIDTLQYVKTLFTEKLDVNDSVRQKVKLKKYQFLTYDVSEVDLVAPVEEFTETDITIPIEIVNVSDTISVKIFPSSVTVGFQVPLSKYEQVNNKMFRAQVLYQPENFNLSSRLKIQLVKIPDFISNPVLKRNTVEYLIEKQ